MLTLLPCMFDFVKWSRCGDVTAFAVMVIRVVLHGIVHVIPRIQLVLLPLFLTEVVSFWYESPQTFIIVE